jgi:curved DNA-binding protein
MEYKDYYATLGLQRSATQDEVKQAYRKLARKYHPDVSKETDSEERFKEVGEAYEVLKDPEKRAAYDRLGESGKGAWRSGQEFQPPPDWDAGFEFSGSGDENDAFIRGGASDFFESLFGHHAQNAHARRRPMHARGEDHHAKILIDLLDAYRGGKRSISLSVPVVDAQGHVSTQERKLDISIPKGILAGQHMRLAGQGEAGIGEGAAGDLFLEIAFNPDPHFRVDGRDVYVDLPVAPWEAALGATLTAATPEGNVQLTIPARSATGRKLRLKGKGIPARTPGDLYAVLNIVLPRADNDAAIAAYAKMAAAFEDFDPRTQHQGAHS